MTTDKTRNTFVDETREEMHNYAQGLFRENEKLRAAVTQLRSRLEDIEQDGQHSAEEYQRIEQQVSNLSNLYVASYQLHSSVDRAAVLQAIQEIVINLIGSEEVAIFERDSDGSFRVTASVGIDDWAFAPFRLGEGPVGRHLLDGEIFVNPMAADGRDRLTACVPLKIGEDVIGAVAVFRLLAHKTQLERLDHELFELLAVHAATALYCATLHAKSLPQEAIAS